MRKGLIQALVVVTAILIVLGAATIYAWCSSKDEKIKEVAVDQIGTQSQAGIIGSNSRIHSEKILIGNYLWVLSQLGTHENLKRSMWSKESYDDLGEWKDASGVFWRKFDQTRIPSESEIFDDVTGYIEENFEPEKLRLSKDMVLEFQNDGKGVTMNADFNVQTSYKSRRMEVELHGADSLAQSSESRLFGLRSNSENLAENSESFIDSYLWNEIDKHTNHACKSDPDPSDVGKEVLDEDLRKALAELEKNFNARLAGSWSIEADVLPGSTSYTTSLASHANGCVEHTTSVDAEGRSVSVPVYSNARDRYYTYEYTAKIKISDSRTGLLTEDMEDLKDYSVTFLIRNRAEYSHPSGTPYQSPNYDSFSN